ncbi:MAG: nucleotidyl transferase AbiEii/AbiGii toxin family protein [Victivallaceae bacterium]|nr:nucleotidyl transferase AbiEii/AbiGii toxin family protein [Victivallaceae bacterium]
MNNGIIASVHQRLLNLRDKTGEPFNNILVKYALERLLYRLEASGKIKNFVLKGAMLFSLWPQVPRRSTRDMDLLGFGAPTTERMKSVFITACKLKYDADGLCFDPDSVTSEDIREEQEYVGVRVKLMCYLGPAKIPLQIDIGFGDAIVPKPEIVEYPRMLDFPAARIKAYHPATVIAEKFNALVVLGYRNSRMKDFYDLYILLKHMNLSDEMLLTAVKETFKRRKVSLPHEIPVAFTPAFLEDGTKLIQWNAFIKRSALDPALQLADVLKYLEERLWNLCFR